MNEHPHSSLWKRTKTWFSRSCGSRDRAGKEQPAKLSKDRVPLKFVSALMTRLCMHTPKSAKFSHIVHQDFSMEQSKACYTESDNSAMISSFLVADELLPLLQ